MTRAQQEVRWMDKLPEDMPVNLFHHCHCIYMFVSMVTICNPNKGET